MNDYIENYYSRFREKLTEEQAFCLMIMMILYGFQRAKSGSSPTSEFTQNSFREAFSDTHKREVADAVFRLSEKMDWHFLENDAEIRDTVETVSNTISQYFSNAFKESLPLAEKLLNMLLEAVLELSESMRGYVATPQCIRQFVQKLLRGIFPEKIADFCCGMALFGMSFCKNNVKTSSVPTLYGVELDLRLCDIGKVLMELYEIHGQIEQKDILALPEKSETAQYDLIIMDIPRGGNGSRPYHKDDPRISGFSRKTIYPDWLFIQDALYHLKEGGYSAVLCTVGALVRANERTLREQVVKNDWLEAVITLPANLYPNTQTGTELLIFHKGKSRPRQNRVLFIDISQCYFRRKRNAYTISDKGLQIACTCFQDYKEIDGISVILKNDMLDTQTCSLKPIHYIPRKEDPAIAEWICLSEISEITRGAQRLKKDPESSEKNVYFINVKDIQDGVVVYDTAEKISGQNPVCKTKYQICEDDILITSKGTSTRISIVEKDPPLAFFSGNITLIRVKTAKYHPYVLFHYLDSPPGKEALERIQSGTTIRILNNQNLSTLKVPRYNFEKMNETGSLLKLKREEFLYKQKALEKNYDKEKKHLLDSLKEEC